MDGNYDSVSRRITGLANRQWATEAVETDHEDRIKALETMNKAVIGHTLYKCQFTQADLDAAVKAERERISVGACLKQYYATSPTGGEQVVGIFALQAIIKNEVKK